MQAASCCQFLLAVVCQVKPWNAPFFSNNQPISCFAPSPVLVLHSNYININTRFMKLLAPSKKLLRSGVTALLVALTFGAFAQNDVGVFAVTSPFEFGRENTELGYATSELVTMRVVNFGSNQQNSIPVGFDFDNGTTTGTGNISTNMFQNDTVNFTFANTVNPTAYGTHTLKVWTALAGDGSIGNDTMYYTMNSVENAPVNLPYVEDFNGAAAQTLLGNTYGVAGLDSWDFITAKQDTGRLRTAAGAGYYASPSRAMTMDVFTALSQFDTVGNKLILTFDMTNFDSQDDIFMDFAVMSHGEGTDPSDKIYIRGEDQEDWLLLHDLDPSSLPIGQYEFIEQINISQVLDDEGQQYSESTQISFGQTDNNASVNLTGADGMTFDDIIIYEPYYITSNPGAASTCTGDTAMFSASVSSEPYEWQWQVNTGSGWSNLSNNATYAGADTNMLQVLSPTAGMSGYQYRVLLNTLNGTMDSSTAATLTVTTGTPVDLGSDADFCNGDTIVLAPALAVPGFLWSDGSTNSTLSVIAGGTYSVTITDALGCTATDDIVLTELTSVPATASLSICAGDSIFIGGAFQSSAGMYNDTIVVSGTCDTIVTTSLSLIVAPVTNTTATICNGDSIVLGGAWQTAPGSYNDTLGAASGCDSIVVTVLSVDSGTVTNASASICNGDSIMLGGSMQTVPGTYFDTLTSVITGCDSVLATTLSFSAALTDSVSTSICMGDSIMLGGAYQTTAGAYIDSLSTSSGCDSIVTTFLTLLTPTTSSANAIMCPGDSMLLGGSQQTLPGTYSDTLPGSNTCDSIVVTTLSLYTIAHDTVSLSICTGDSALLGGSQQTTSGFYTDTLTAATGCDSLVTTNLSVVTVLLTTVSEGICDGDSIMLGGAWQTTAGTYQDSLTSASGCDSIVTTTLTINVPVSGTGSATICAGDSIMLGGVWQTAAGTYLDTLMSGAGCDSIATITLTVTAAVTSTGSATICVGDSILLGGAWQTAAGTYMDTLVSAAGCDSIVTVTLSVTVALTSTESASICAGDSLMVGGAWQTAAGSYQDTLASVSGCDSIVTTTLTVTGPVTTMEAVSLCEGDSLMVGGGWQLGDGVYTDSLQTSAGCDSIVETTLSFWPAVFETVDVTICEGDSVMAGGSWQTTAGSYSDTFSSAIGCDSVVTTDLVVTPLPTISVSATSTLLAEGESTDLTATGADGYTWSPSGTLSSATGATVTATPTDTTEYTVTGTSNGCASTATITIFVDIDDAVPFIVNGVPLRAWMSTNNLMLELGSGAPGKYEYALYTVAGQRVANGIISKPANAVVEEITLDEAATGTYILQVRNSTSRSSTKVFKR